MTPSSDVLVIGCGIAGVSVAAELARFCSVVIVEAEEMGGYHATGRSAASIGRSYGNNVVQRLTALSAPFLSNPPPEFTDIPLVKPRPWVFVATPDQQHLLNPLLANAPTVRRISGDEVRHRVPILAEDYVGDGGVDESCADVDVDALTQAYLRRFRSAGGKAVFGTPVRSLLRCRDGWRVTTDAGELSAGIIVNAAGAWADEVGAMAGARRLELVPHRRTAILVEPPLGVNASGLPLTMDVGEAFYFKPEAGQIMVSPADETPSVPCDAQADEYDVAVAAHRFEIATGLPVRRVTHRWAGLRTFAKDRTPVVGFDPAVDGFFWLAGQGGYGVQTAPALARLAAELVRRQAISDREFSPELAAAVSPARFMAPAQ